MLYYIYYGYTIYKIYKYTHMLQYGYNTLYYTYSLTYRIYNMLNYQKKCEKDISNFDNWVYINE